MVKLARLDIAPINSSAPIDISAPINIPALSSGTRLKKKLDQKKLDQKKLDQKEDEELVST